MVDALLADFDDERFLQPEAARSRLLRACDRHPALVRHERVGESEGGRPIDGFILGNGDLKVSLIAGNHSDEPVGPDFLRRLVSALVERSETVPSLLDRFQFFIVPHTNPDGEERNASWRSVWPDFAAYLQHAFREPPGRDVEFGFPDLRDESVAVADWLRAFGPFDLHGSLHGMAIAEGALLLIERRWGYRTPILQGRFRTAAREAGLGLHDHNRQGEKGFFYLAPGFWTTPEGAAMRDYFRARGDAATASLFRDSSMEFVRSLGGDPLCYVTELPLFVVDKTPDAPAGRPDRYLELKQALPELRLRLERGESIDGRIADFGLQPVALGTALRLQMRTLAAALAEVAEPSREG